MLQTDNVAESLQCYSGKPEIPELPVTFQIGGIENDMVMNMCPVHMSCNNKCVLSFCESHAGFISDFVCFLRCNLSRLEGLADLICNHISLRLPPCLMQIFLFCLSKFQINKLRITLIRRNIFSLIRFFSIHGIIGPVFQTPHHTPAFILVHCYQFCCRHLLTCLT